MAFEFSQGSRIKSENQIRSLLTGGKKRSFCYFAARHLKNSLPYARLGILVSKKRVRRAVDRNRLRRMAREVFRQLSAEIAPYDFLICFYSVVFPADSRQCMALLKQAFLSAGKPADGSALKVSQAQP